MLVKSITTTLPLLVSITLNNLYAAPFNIVIDNIPSRFSYSYVQLQANTDNTPKHGNTFGIGGSYNVIPHVNLLATYTTTDLNNSNKNINLFSIGVGYHIPIGLNTDVTTNIRYIDEEEARTSGDVTTSVSDSGASAGVGIRHLFSQFLEGNANLNFTHVHDSNAKTTLGLRYHYSNQLSGEVNYTIDDDDNVGASVRLSF